MAGIPSGEGRDDANHARDRSIPVLELFTPFPSSVTKFLCEYNLDLIGEMWFGLSDLSFDEGLEALGKVRYVAFPVAMLQSFELSHEPYYCRENCIFRTPNNASLKYAIFSPLSCLFIIPNIPQSAYRQKCTNIIKHHNAFLEIGRILAA
jgi:hypothetical protein